MIEEPLEHVLLDLLVDGLSSGAALFGTLVHHLGYKELEVSLVMAAFSNMERQGWVRAVQMADDGSFHEPSVLERERDLAAYEAWLPHAQFEELSVDEVGLWYEITTKGRAEWSRRALPDDEEPVRWMINDLKDVKSVSVHAESVDIAERALRWWLSRNPDFELVDNSGRTDLPTSFTLRDGTVITNGVKLAYEYRLKAW